MNPIKHRIVGAPPLTKATLDDIADVLSKSRPMSRPSGRRFDFVQKKYTVRGRKRAWKKKMVDAAKHIRSTIKYDGLCDEKVWRQQIVDACRNLERLVSTEFPWTFSVQEEIDPVDKRYANAPIEEVWVGGAV